LPIDTLSKIQRQVRLDMPASEAIWWLCRSADAAMPMTPVQVALVAADFGQAPPSRSAAACQHHLGTGSRYVSWLDSGSERLEQD